METDNPKKKYECKSCEALITIDKDKDIEDSKCCKNPNHVLLSTGYHKNEHDELKKILKNPNLFNEITGKEFDKRITGEIKSRKALFLSLCSIWLKDTEIPLNTLVSSESSAGKSYICKQITKIFPQDLLIYRSKISAEAFTYWHVNEEDWTWNGKILFLEDIAQGILDSTTFKCMCSDETTATVVRNQKAIDLFVNGNPCILITTASTNPNREILNRFNIVSLDESSKQTEEVTYNEALENKKEDYNPLVIDSLNLLKRCNVNVPFALDIHNHITKVYGWNDIRMRRDFSRLRDLIKCSTVLHQYQREEIDGKLIATKQDYNIARECINYIQTNTLKGLVHKLRKAYDSCINFKGSFTAKDIHGKFPFVSLQMWYQYIDELCSRGLLEARQDIINFSDKPVTKYSIKENTSFMLPSFEDLTKKELKELNQLTPNIDSKEEDNTEISQSNGLKGLNGLNANNNIESKDNKNIDNSLNSYNMGSGSSLAPGIDPQEYDVIEGFEELVFPTDTGSETIPKHDSGTKITIGSPYNHILLDGGNLWKTV